MITLVNNEMTKAFLGSTEVKKICLGNEQVWPVESALPYDAEIEYLNCPDETTAGLYRINFGINMTYGRGFGFTFSDLKFGGTQWGAVAGTTWSTKRVQIYRNSADNQINIDWNNSIALQNRSLDQNKHTIDIKPIINGTQTQLIIDDTVIKNINNFELGGTSADSIKWIPPQSTSLITGKLYRFWIYDTDQSLLLDAIPVRIGSVGYMYDKVSGQLFGNAGTGSFTLGPDVI